MAFRDKIYIIVVKRNWKHLFREQNEKILLQF